MNSGSAADTRLHANQALIEHFFASFAKRDGAAMAACYAPDAHFADPIFELDGAAIGGMWSMFCDRGHDLAISWRDVRTDVDNGSAHWDARYTFSLTGRKVHNRIAAAFTFRDGKFASHRDSFDLWRWSRMALGPKGAVLGWTPFVRNTIREQGRRGLDTWMARQAS
jgi:ketosteroid isomerase-like protein